MEIKNTVINKEDLNTYLGEVAHFGWEFFQKKDISKKKIKVTVKRNRANIKYTKLLKVEKQYNKINRPVSISACVNFVIGLSFLIPFFILLDNPYAYAFLAASIMFLLFSLYALLIFVFAKKNRQVINAELLMEADTYSGVFYSLPYPNAIKEKNEETFNIKNYYRVKR